MAGNEENYFSTENNSLLCSSCNIVEYEGESSAVPEKSQVIWDVSVWMGFARHSHCSALEQLHCGEL